MDPRIKRTLILAVLAMIAFLVAVALTGHFTPAGKGILHGTMSFIFLILVFSVWSSFRQITGKKIILSIVWAVLFYFGLPIAIDLVAFLPIAIKGVAHYLVIVLFVAAFIWIWYDETKSPKYHQAH